jgi:hypothetical protein
MNTQENNKMIAEFMGYSQPHPDYPNTTYWYKEGEEPLVLLSFDRDWNWLMIVVGKIQLLDIVHDNTRSYDSVFKEWICTFSPAFKTHDFGNIIGKSKKSEFEAVFNACMEFIKWNNLNNLKNS